MGVIEGDGDASTRRMKGICDVVFGSEHLDIAVQVQDHINHTIKRQS